MVNAHKKHETIPTLSILSILALNIFRTSLRIIGSFFRPLNTFTILFNLIDYVRKKKDLKKQKQKKYHLLK